MEIGAQLFTVKDFCKDLDGFSKTLKRVADIGYKNVQISGTCNYDPIWLKEQLDKNELRCVLTHIPTAKLIDETEKVAKEHDVFECENVGLGFYSFNDKNDNTSFDYFFEAFTPVMNLLAKNGKYFMYHNHDQEFKKRDNKLIIEHIAERMPADKFGFIIDTFWVQAAGGDPAMWIEKLSGRVPCIHLKDYAYGKVMSVIGEGNINFDRIFEKAESAGTKYMLVEQDDCNGEDPFECLKRSYNYLKALGF